jgi:serine/threonine-protein kinase
MRRDTNSHRAQRMFRDEIRITASLCHPNIVDVRDCNTVDESAYLVMEYVHGKDLRKLLARAAKHQLPIPFDVIVAIVAAACAGLHHAHEQLGIDGVSLGIVHRDVSPTNILVGFDGRVKVIDFGVAKASFTREEPTLVKGKTSYMAPEQCLGKPVDRRADIFAMGIVLYELVTSSKLFKGADDVATMRAITFGHVPFPVLRRPDVSPQLETAIMRALAQRPEDRFQTAAEMRSALLACVPILPTEAIVSKYMLEHFDPQAMPRKVEDEVSIVVEDSTDVLD